MEYNKRDYYILKNEYGQVLFIGRLKHIRRRFKYVSGHLPALSIPKEVTAYGYQIELVKSDKTPHSGVMPGPDPASRPVLDSDRGTKNLDSGSPYRSTGQAKAGMTQKHTTVYNTSMKSLKEKLKELPHKPGTYLFKDKDARILYVGKAKDLRNRVLQYFGADSRPQLPYLMKEAADLDYTVVSTELESLFLENTLIKQYLPPYNIKLRDDKNYAFIKIDYGTPIPQISYARKIEDNESVSSRPKLAPYSDTGSRDPDSGFRVKPGMTQAIKYLGPYSSARKIKQTLDFVRRIFPYCANKESGKRPCFYYYLHRCPGICIGAISMQEYINQLKRIEQFLKGDTSTIKKDVKREMQAASSSKQFERAARLRDQLQALEVLDERQTMMFPSRVTWDFVSVYEEYGDTCINLFKIREGKLIDKENFIYQTVIRKTDGRQKDGYITETLEQFLGNYYNETSDLPKEIYIQSPINNQELIRELLRARAQRKVPLTVPTRGKKLSLIKLGITNAREYLRKWQASQATNTDAINNTLIELQKLLKLPTLPRRIEGYDISNTQGTNPVSSMVVTKDGLPAKGEYRKFKINVKQTPDDFAMMRETLTRRLARISIPDVMPGSDPASKNKDLDSGSEAGMTQRNAWPRPDLIVIDGGKGQLGVAYEVIKTAGLKIPVIGLAKRIEEIFVPGKSKPIVLSHDNPVLQLLQRLRDEAHRFGITFHRQLRSKQATKSALDAIPGIGPKTKKLLKSKFGTVANIRSKTVDELGTIVGKSKAEIIKRYL